MSRLQNMPIMDRLYMGSTMDLAIGETLLPVQVDRLQYEAFAAAKRVRLTDADRIPYLPMEASWDIAKIFGHLMLPFPRVWVEWNNMRGEDGQPDVWMAAVCEHIDSVLEMESALGLGMPPLPAEKYSANTWTMRPLMLHGSRVVALPMLLMVDLDAAGVLVGVRGFDYGAGGQVGASKFVVDLMWDALVAIGWMNCRNVRVEQHDRSANVAGTRRKRNQNLARSLDFHTIHLPGVDGEYERHDGGGEATHPVRLHHVRGHFKTFADERPLLGKHTGTYWWGWQVRGNKGNGAVVSDYKVGALV